MAHILLVEDYPIIAKSVKYALESKGFKVTHLDLGSKAMAYLENHEVDLVLLDVEFKDEPHINGFNVLAHIRKTSMVPVIIVSGKYIEPSEIEHGFTADANDYLVKPFDNRVLIARIKNCIKRANKLLNPPTFKINTAMQQIDFKGRTLILTSVRFKILAFLINHPSAIHSKPELLNAAGTSASSVETINTHIKLIRDELLLVEPDSKRNKHIKTHTNKGYSLVI